MNYQICRHDRPIDRCFTCSMAESPSEVDRLREENAELRAAITGMTENAARWEEANVLLHRRIAELEKAVRDMAMNADGVMEAYAGATRNELYLRAKEAALSGKEG